jgi:hypothetical protein
VVVPFDQIFKAVRSVRRTWPHHPRGPAYLSERRPGRLRRPRCQVGPRAGRPTLPSAAT